ncbi:uncharacterized protein LOC110185049 isoform X2 [Drosophila serrata]|uniref:uncharacterized protein LOC110185049 isoform X2 n=1 Tax=Drosophila serrata TaxID=7274 RepID=UPI000A1D1CD2|nr:uncharacterized protein LOC110185049 isoform X2 [Drosophila serrata]
MHLMEMVESETLCHDLDNLGNNVENELKTCDCNLIGVADDSASKISLILQIVKQIPDKEATESLQKPVTDYTVNGIMEVNCLKTEVKTIETPTILQNVVNFEINTKLSLKNMGSTENESNYSDIRTNNMPLTEEESPKDHTSSITEKPVEEAFSADQCETSPEKIVNSETTCNQNLESTKDIKESGSGSESMQNQCEKLPEKIIDSETICTHNMESTIYIKESGSTSESVNELLENNQCETSPEKIVNSERTCNHNLESTKDIKESGSGSGSMQNQCETLPEKIIDSETICTHNMESTIYIKESGSTSESVNELLENNQCETSPEKIVNSETICTHNLESTKDIKESGSSSESVNELLGNKNSVVLESGELSQDPTVNVKQDRVQAARESHDLEDGEVSDDDDEATLKVPVCRFYVRNGCSWGNNCRFRHPGASKKGNYVMFENKVLPVVSTPLPLAWTPPMPPVFPFNLNNVNSDRYYSQDQPEGSKRSPLLPTPSFNDILLAQKNYRKLGDIQRSVPNMEKAKPIVWQSRPNISSPSPTTSQWSPPRTSVSPPRHSNHIRVEVRSTDTANPTCKPSVKRCRLPSPSQSPVTKIRGPRTPPSSPPVRQSATIQTAPKRQRLYTYLSSSTDSSESYNYTSSTESSEDSSSSSDSDREFRRKISRRIEEKQPSRVPTKSSSRTPTKCTSRHVDKCSSGRHETSVMKRTSKHTSKSTSRKNSSKTKKKSSKRMLEDSSRFPSKTSRKSFYEGSSSSLGRREYLLLKLLQVEEQIAKKKKKMNMKG